MRRFVLLIHNDPELLDGLPQERFNEQMRSCLAHADELRREGRLLDTRMLQDARSGRTVRVRDGVRTVVDGPFAETKELLAGFNLIEAEDMDAALRIAAEFPWTATGSVEVRELVDVEAVREAVNAPAPPAG